jgi:hypothetical protein
MLLSRAHGRSLLAFVLPALLAMGAVGAPAAFPSTSAVFSATTSGTGNDVTAGDIAPPTALAVTQSCSSVSAPVHRGSSSTTGVTTLTIPIPAGTAAGDVMIAQVMNRNTATLTAPAGWTSIRRDTSGAEVQVSLFWKVATGSDTAPTFTLSMSFQMAGGIVSYSGAHTTDPIDAHSGSTGNSATATTPSVTTTRPDTRVLRAIGKRQEALAAPAGTTQRWSVSSGGSAGAGGASLGDSTLAAAGATGTAASTSGGAFVSDWVAQTVAIRAASGTPSASATWTASPTTGASGYVLDRVVGGSVTASKTVTPVSATSTTDGPLVGGTTYTYRLRAYRGNWTSTDAVATLTPAC